VTLICLSLGFIAGTFFGVFVVALCQAGAAETPVVAGNDGPQQSATVVTASRNLAQAFRADESTRGMRRHTR